MKVTTASRPDTRHARLSKLSRWLIAVSAALLAVTFIVPIWRIDLIAPQYPEGLGMLIRIDTITGIKPNDLNNINGLNHYIGMKAIEPEKIPILQMMPIALAVLIVAGLFAALSGRRWVAWSWIAALSAAGAYAMFDFWRWSYDYGHDLDPHAIIKVPGMSYQPPLIGSKQLLNFTATSLPATGAWIAVAAFLLALFAMFWRKQHRAGGAKAGIAVEAAIAASLVFAPLLADAQGSRGSHATVIVSPSGPVRTLTEALELVTKGGRVIVKAGHYREYGIEVRKPVTISGEGLPLFDASGRGEILRIFADDVTVRGIRLANVGTSHVEDRAAIRATGVRGCVITDNRMENAFFGIYLAKTEDCLIERNTLTANGKSESTSGNGVHLWSSRGIRLRNNVITGFRDGIYFEFVHDTEVTGNRSERNLRYGLHFMYSDDCVYTANVFKANGAGVAVMYTNRVHMVRNRFESNWGSAAYGLLLKEIADSRLEGNVFENNTTGLVADGANRIKATRNTFARNGWAIKVEGSTLDGSFSANTFTGNTFDVATNSRTPSSVFTGNYWDEYRGYDLDGDGIGDIPHAPVRLFAVIVERSPQAIVLLRSALVSLLDIAERAMPSLTPELFVDSKPAMRKPS